MRAMYMYGGGRMCFPVRECRCLPESHCIFHRSCSLVLRSLFLPGRPDVFSWPRLCTTSSPLLHSPILLISTRSSCASMVWTDTVFGVVRLAAHFEVRRRFSGCMRTGLCGLASAHQNPGDWPCHPGCHSCMLSLWKRGGLAHIWTLSPDGCNRRRPQRVRIPAEFRARVFKNLSAPAEP